MKLPVMLGLLILFLAGCRNNQEKSTETAPPIEHEEAVHPEQTGSEDDIELDNGNKWKVDRGTTEGIQRISELVKETPTRSVEDYRELGNKLEEEKRRFDNQTQENQRADESLKTYLEPLEEKIGQLQAVNSTEQGEKLKAEIEEHLQNYSGNFM